MKTAIGLFILSTFISAPALSGPTALEDISHKDKEVFVENVHLKSAEITEETYPTSQVRSLLLVFELDLMGTGCNIIDGYIMRLLAPSSYSVKIPAHDPPDCLTIGKIKPIGTATLTVKLEQFDKRPVSESGKPWPKFDWSKYWQSPIRYYTFTNSSYFQGYEILKLFKLDMTDIENVRLEFYKTISYSADQVVVHE